MTGPMFKAVDCLMLYVPDLEAALEFYQGKLGHALNWRDADSAGLKLPGSNAELVLQVGDRGMEVDLLVDSADRAAEDFVKAGGAVVVPPFDIRIGRCVVVKDPWEHVLVLLDMSKGALVTDEQGRVIGSQPAIDEIRRQDAPGTEAV